MAGVIMLAIFVMHWCNITLFSHSHDVAGVHVVHSHPYKSQHHHAESQVVILCYLTHIQAAGVPPCVCLEGLLPEAVLLDEIPSYRSVPNSDGGFISYLRAPPAVISI